MTASLHCMENTDDLASSAARLGVQLERALLDALRPASDEQSVLLYSAGVDSAVLAWLCQAAGRYPLLLSIGTVGFHDRRFVEQSHPFLRLPLQIVTVSEDDIAEAIPTTRHLLREAGVFSAATRLNLIHLALGVGIYLACQVAAQRGARVVLTANGPDTLFAGYDRYRRVPPEHLPATLEQDTQNSLAGDLVRDRAIAAAFDIELAAPFLEARVIELSHQIPVEHKLGPAGNKLVLREMARQKGVPEFIAGRPKKAMQFSTGIWPIVRRHAASASL